MRSLTVLVPLLLILLIAIFTSPSFAIRISQPGVPCSDPSHDACTITFYLDPKLGLNRTEEVRIVAPEWAAALQTVTSPYNECAISQDSQALIIRPQSLPFNMNIVTCYLFSKDNFSVIAVHVPTYDLTLPPLAYYTEPIAFRAHSPNCGVASSPEPCDGEFIFPIAATPFVLETTSTLALDEMECVDAYNHSIRIPISSDALQITPRITPNVDRINKYDIILRNPTYTRTSSLISCRGYFAKSQISPHFRVLDRTSLMLFQTNLIQGNEVVVMADNDCSDEKTNACLLIYRFSSKLPPYSFQDLRTEAKGFPQALTQPGQCPPHISNNPLYISPDYNFLCQSWRKALSHQVYQNSNSESLHTIPSLIDNTITFFGQYFYGIQGHVPTDSVEYTTPLEWVFVDGECGPAFFSCPIHIRSRHSGSAAEISFSLPFSAITESVNCNSPYMTFNQRDRKLIIGGGPDHTEDVPTPDSWWECIVHVKRSPFGFDSVVESTHIIYLYREYNPPFLATTLLPEAELHSISLPAFTSVPFTIHKAENCLALQSDWCSIRFELSTGSDYMRSFEFSVDGIVTTVREGRTTKDWKFEWDDPDANIYDGKVGNMTITSQATMWDFPTDIEPGSHALYDRLPTKCTQGTTPRCRLDPTEPLTILHDCTPACDPSDPDKSSVNPTHIEPCTRCQESITLFRAEVVGVVRSSFTFSYRKQPWLISYQNLLWFYSYGGVSYPFNQRFGDGQIRGGTPLDEIVAEFHPEYAVTFLDCDRPSAITCNLAVSRSNSEVRMLYYDIFHQGNFVSGFMLEEALIFNQTSLSYQSVTHSFLIPQIKFLDLWMPFSKVVGANMVLDVLVYPVKSVNYIDPTTLLPGTHLEFDGPPHVHTTDLIYTGDGLPSFSADCDETSSRYCTITYTFQSFVTMMSRPAQPAPPRPIEILKHYVPAQQFISGFEFVPQPPGTVVTGTKRKPNSVERDYDNDYPITTTDFNCVGNKMDISTTFGFTYEPSVLTPNGQDAGTLAIEIITGEVPYGATCQLIMTKKPTLAPAKRIREPLIAQYGQLAVNWTISPDNFLVRFPRTHYAKLTLLSGLDCRTQTERLICTVQLNVYATALNPLSRLHTSFSSLVRHPYFDIGANIPIWANIDSQDPNGTAPTQVQMGRIEVQEVANPNPPRPDLPATSPYNLLTHITLFIHPGWRDRNSSGFLTFTPTDSQVNEPWSSRTFPMQFATDDQGYELDAISVQFPPSVTAELFSIASNITLVDLGASNGVVTIDFKFKFGGIQQVTIDQDFSFSPLLIKDANDELKRAGQTPNTDSSIFHPHRIPCYMRRSDEQKVTDLISVGQFAQHFETTDPGASHPRTIAGWVVYNPATKQSILTPVNPTAMANLSCYIFYQVDRKTKSNRVKHEIITTANSQPSGGTLTVHYEAFYPTFVHNSRMINIK